MISVQFSVSRNDREIVGDIFECSHIDQAIEALREAADTLEAEEAPNPRERDEDDGSTYSDPRDERDERRGL